MFSIYYFDGRDAS
ncbi:Hypothetical protein PFREUD_21020 [Propionibacterium freudenreichii subsp. shermanii CIRM-BIA1]|uniref:Uncharacterized protein n=1 Tax=Propionibacterium freudenreichii subsp. shermanii (strain ATCC 9614 / DSM 4902 / CIP 103027 / NCIMB 8099 / CIRM-BIA1) TaxID=754252 RepID=D7GGD4_PROFC|nr:Hypothetical protein PFREUD_21020 [Propionibacterium freudenreichii subsp. shermanii CIRM-BIA1]